MKSALIKFKKTLTILLSIILLLSLVPFNAVASSEKTFDEIRSYNGHYYGVYVASGLTWDDAYNYCVDAGGYLATITDAQEQIFVESISYGYSLWLGGYRDDEFNWYWVTDEDWDYTNWMEGEPNDSSNVVSDENCLTMWPCEWNDLNENNIYEQQGFVCEWDSYDEIVDSPQVPTDFVDPPVYDGEIEKNTDDFESTQKPTKDIIQEPSEDYTEDLSDEWLEEPTEDETEDYTQEPTEDETEYNTEDFTDDPTDDWTDDCTEDPSDDDGNMEFDLDVEDISAKFSDVIFMSKGYYDYDFTDDGLDIEYYYYDPDYFNFDMYITLTNGDVIYTDMFDFEYNDQEYYIDYSTNQTATSPWGVGEHTITLFLGDVEKDFTFNIVESPVESLIIKTKPLIEKSDGYLDFDYDEDDKIVYYWYYDVDLFVVSCTVIMKNGEEILCDGCLFEYNGVDYEIEFETDQYYDSPWGVGEHVVNVSLFDYSTTIVAKIVKEEDFCHSWADEYTIDKHPTCSKKGSKSIHCTVCGEKKEDTITEIPPLGHNTVVENKSKPTYFKAGYTGDTVCKVCNKIVKNGEIISKLKLNAPKATVKGGKKLTVKYSKVTNATGYIVKYVYKKKVVVKEYNSKKSAKKVFKNLKNGNYKVQVRSFIKQGKNIAYSKWTKIQKVKIKK